MSRVSRAADATQRSDPDRYRRRPEVGDQLGRQLRQARVQAGDVHDGRRRPGVRGEQGVAAAHLVDLDVAQVDGDPRHRGDLLLVRAQALQTAYADQPAAELQLVADRQRPPAQGAGHHRPGTPDGERAVDPQADPPVGPRRRQPADQVAQGRTQLGQSLPGLRRDGDQRAPRPGWSRRSGSGPATPPRPGSARSLRVTTSSPWLKPRASTAARCSVGLPAPALRRRPPRTAPPARDPDRPAWWR